MPIDYSVYKSPRLVDVYSQNGGALPEGFDRNAFYRNFNIQYDPQSYSDMGEAIRQWIAAGRPDIDRYGNELDTRGQLVTTGFGVPTWAQGNPNPATSSGYTNPTNGFLQQFAQKNPWASQFASSGGWEGLGGQLRTITQDDFNKYSPEMQGLIQQYLNGVGYKPSWAQGNNWATPAAGTPTGQPATGTPNPAARPAGTLPYLGGGRGGQGAGVAYETSVPGLQNQSMGMPVNPAARGSTGATMPGSFGRGRRPTGYQGY